MPRITTAYVKNIIRRGFSELVDPAPDRVAQERIWVHFHARCAYCGSELARGRKEGHIDHLVSASAGGSNSIANRVLACAPCNEKEKRELPWEEFLRMKSQSEDEFAARRDQILQWQQVSASEKAAARPSPLDAAAIEMANEVIALFEKRVVELRRLVRGGV